jgi:hypothetical protein
MLVVFERLDIRTSVDMCFILWIFVYSCIHLFIKSLNEQHMLFFTPRSPLSTNSLRAIFCSQNARSVWWPTPAHTHIGGEKITVWFVHCLTSSPHSCVDLVVGSHSRCDLLLFSLLSNTLELSHTHTVLPNLLTINGCSHMSSFVYSFSCFAHISSIINNSALTFTHT